MMPATPDDTDAMLAGLLAPPARGGDRSFALRVAGAIDARAAYARARTRFWRSFGVEALAIASLLAALWLLSGTTLIAPIAERGQWGLAPPLLLVWLLWLGGTQRLRSA